MKILLIRYHDERNVNTRLPKALNDVQGIYPPLGIAYIAANLEKNGFDVEVLDVQALNLTSSEARDAIIRRKADVAGITCMTPNFNGALEAARFAKESGAIVVLGGPAISVYPKESVDFGFVDFAIEGEAEEAFVELVRAIGRKKPVEKIRGLVYKKGGKIFCNGPVVVRDLDAIPMPAWHLLPMDKYHCIISRRPFATLMTSRGCPYRCGFCFKSPTDDVFRMHDPKRIVDEMELLIRNYKVKEIMFYDDTFTLNRQHVVDLCNEILRRGLKIKWEAPTRLNTIDLGLLRLMRRAGCFRLRFGIESGDPRIIQLMRKGITPEMTRKVLRWARMVGMQRFAYFIIGYYSEDRASIRRTINFAKELDPEWVMFTTATPLPKTNLFDLCRDSGIIDENYWLRFIRGENDGRIDYLVKGSEKFVKRAYMEFYFRPRFIIRKLFTIGSFEELKNYFEGAMAILKINYAKPMTHGKFFKMSSDADGS